MTGNKAQKMNPIIIIGMHRSGTSLLSKLLQNVDFFMGHSRDKNEESRFFLKLNHWVFNQIGASWDNPHNFGFADKTFEKLISAQLKLQLNNFESRVRYFGFKKCIQHHSFNKLHFDWGWKDPRNTYTLPLWRSLFPNAKIVYIYRNPIDVMQSMRVREIQKLNSFSPTISDKLKRRFYKGLIIKNSFRLLHFDECFKLWKQYNTQALSYDQCYHIKYEDLLENPNEIFGGLITHLGLDISTENIHSAVQNINTSRKYAFSENKELIELYKSYKDDPLVKELNYHQILSS